MDLRDSKIFIERKEQKILYFDRGAYHGGMLRYNIYNVEDHFEFDGFPMNDSNETLSV